MRLTMRNAVKRKLISRRPSARAARAFRLNLAGPADVSTISPVVDWVMEAVRETGCAAGKEFEIETALREALANAIIHGCRNDPHKKVEVQVACRKDGSTVIVVRDPGPGFDVSRLPNPMEGENIYSQHGRGIFLINRMMDDVRFERGGKQIRMRKR